MPGNDIEQLITVHNFALGVHHQHPIAITVKGNTQISPGIEHLGSQGLRMCRPTLGVDVGAVGLGTDDSHLGTEFLKYPRRNVIGGTVGAIDHQLEPSQAKLPINGSLAEFDVATWRILQTSGSTQIV